MTTDPQLTVQRRPVLRKLGLLFSSAAALVFGARAARSQNPLGANKRSKREVLRDPGDVIARARHDIGLSADGMVQVDANVTRSRMTRIVTDGEAADDLSAAVQRDTRLVVRDLLLTERYEHDVLIKMKFVMLDAEKRIQDVAQKVLRHEMDQTDADPLLTKAFQDYFHQLELLPTR